MPAEAPASGDAKTFPIGGGALGELIRAQDWSQSVVGASAGWPQSLRTIIDTMLASHHGMMLAWGPQLTLFYNDAYAPFLGQKHPWALGRPFAEAWSDIWSEIEPLVEQALSGEAVSFDDYFLVMERNGAPEDTWWKFSYSPIRDDAGTIVGLLNVASEMTAKVLTLRRQEFRVELDRRLRPLSDPQAAAGAAAEALGRHIRADQVGYAEVDPAGEQALILRDWNGGAMASNAGLHRMEDFGPAFIADLALGHTVAIADVREDPRTASPAATAAFEARGIRAFLNVPLIKNGRLVAVLAVHQGAPRDWTQAEITLSVDVAERTWEAVERGRAETQLREINETLEQRVASRTAELERLHDQLRQSQKLEAMGALTGGVAHDFNNLLSPIYGSLDLLQRRGLGGDRERRLIDGALQSAERARVLVQRLLAFARRQPLQAQAVDLNALVGGMTELIASTIGPQVRVELDLAAGLPIARADLNQVEMALLNLCVNARDAMPDGGVLTLSSRLATVEGEAAGAPAAGRYVVLTVADTGSGMDKATLDRAIEPFFSTKGIGQGTGLGLSMVHGLAAQLGGALTIASRPGEGTSVELWLQASEEAAPAARPAARTGGAPLAAGAALLVDDEPLVRASTADMLAELGYTVAEAGSAEDALKLVEAGLAFDTLVTDHLMAGRSGTELAREVLRRLPEVQVLIISGYADVEGIARDLARLIKPFKQADLAFELAKLQRPSSD